MAASRVKMYCDNIVISDAIIWTLNLIMTVSILGTRDYSRKREGMDAEEDVGRRGDSEGESEGTNISRHM